jgi:cellulose synthase/poly-beta-1,6-N-acetylglucosamine synthase-like glycosyltransferase
MTDILYITLTLLLLYIYAGYPVLLFIVAKLFPKRHRWDDSFEPTVTLIIAAHNEEDVIEAKLINAFAMDYPVDKLLIMVVSDGSTDRTDDIVRTFEDRGVKLIRPAERRGKTAGLNLAITHVTSEVVVFSDANAMYDRFAIRGLVRHFADEKVGYAVGYAGYESSADSAAGSSEGAYWNIEVKIKEWESAFSSVVGGDGAIYAIRTHLYEPLLETDINDFVNPLQIVSKGYRGIFDAAAWCTEKPAGRFDKEFSRKVRIANRSFNGLLRVADTCSPLKVGRFAWQVISHKLLRWFSPFILCLHFVAALVAAGTGQLVTISALCITVMYGLIAALALVGWWHDKRKQSAVLFYIPYYFVLMNLALYLGVIMRLKGTVISIWETVREQSSRKNSASGLLPFLLAGIFSLVIFRISLLLDIYHQVLHFYEFIIVALLFHAYAGYPLLLLLLAKLKPVHISQDEGFLPTVTLLIVAYNEEREIYEKLGNSLTLDYPPELLRIIVASDGSTDATNEIVSIFNERVELFAFTTNRGKTAALNAAMEKIDSDIVVLSDANVMYDHKVLRNLVRNFNDPRVGAVSGLVILVNNSVSYKDSERAYYSIEHFIQAKEGETGAMVGADGAMYAIRRSLFRPPANDTILDDFVIAMSIALDGYIVAHEPEALGFEMNVLEIAGEFNRKSRIVAGGFQCLFKGEVLPTIDQPLLLLKFISHKVLRWISGPLIIALLFLMTLSLILDSSFEPFFTMVYWSVAGAALLAALAHLMPILRTFLPLNMLYYFFMLMAASLTGLYRELTGKQKVTWRGGTP